MKDYLKKTLAALLCIAALLSLAACGAGAPAAKGAETASPASTGETAAALSASVSGAEHREGKRVYLAGPLFSQSEKDFNLKLANFLEAHGYEVFLPQRDGIEAALLEGKTEEELTRMIFALDHSEVLKADIVFMNLDGRVPDEGACVELGIAYASGKRCYGVKTDTRSVELNMDVNPMVSGCMIRLFKDYDGDSLFAALEQYLAENEL